ncbi:NAD(P)/FAD-dependent oxidoreductase [Seohaeicola zhoushanensis]|uniref:Oxidoreductase n=1 Tax=Seohaeicola zhoushanensis TaxID=1569283 RepID=A0A8J3M4Y2_9RHOB|nr:FAD-binding oxidoreductase [Seohaeicola zhoushanensis]GHF41067.1 oxidoreductase [Seohaeicola zhoushanensis]
MSAKGWAATPKHAAYDVVIVGGAMYGASVSWWLSGMPDFKGRILVIERDPAYNFASTSHTNSSIRQQYSQAINVEISRFGAEFIHNFKQFMGGDERVPPIVLQSFGYLYLADTPAFAEALKAAQAVQAACGAATRFWSVDEIAEAYPFYNLDGILGGNHNLVNEGYFDGATIFDWFKRVGRERGVEYIHNEAVAMTLNAAGTRVESVTLKSGETVACGQVVNASGPRAVLTARMAGIEIPVEPRKRFTFIFDAEKPLDRALPLTIDPSGVHMRSDGRYYMCGCPPDDDHAVDYTDFDMDHSIWEEKIWPAVATRVPQFEAVKVVNSWAGHYAYNTLDQNAIVGPHPVVTNFHFVNGFSGHGLQQSPAIGRGMAEMLVFGEYRTLDLTPFAFERIAENRLLLEKAII